MTILFRIVELRSERDRTPQVTDLDRTLTLENDQVRRLFTVARAGGLSRRQLLEMGLRLGLASPAIVALIEATPKSASAALSEPAPAISRQPVQDQTSATLQVLITSGTEDIDPHYSYSTLSSTVALAVYEMLIILKG